MPPAPTTDLLPVDADAFMREMIEGEGVIREEDPIAITRAIVERILSAQNDQDVFRAGQVTGWEEMKDIPVLVEDISARESAFDEGPKRFLIVTATAADNGEPLTLTTGSVNVMAQLIALKRLGAFPVKVKLVISARESASGFRPHWLARA